MGDTIAYIAVGVFGGVCVIAILILIIVLLRRKKQSAQTTAASIASDQEADEVGVSNPASTDLPPWMEYGDAFRFKIPRPDKYNYYRPEKKANLTLNEPTYPSSLNA
jgi:hypothetical protein